ncbi:phosphatidate cytidylyltransferase [Corynebacterium sp. 335C]
MTQPERDRIVREMKLPRPRNSAGRDVPVAIAVGVALGALAVAGLFVGPVLWYPVVALAAALGTWEVVSRMREHDWLVPRTVLIIGGQLMIWLTIPLGSLGLLTGLVASMVLALGHRMFFNGMEFPRNWLRDASVAMLVLLWIPLNVAFAAMLSLGGRYEGIDGRWYIVTFMLCVVANDVGGYVAGVFFGKHPMAPQISPKKSWEGFAGSVVLGAAAGAACSVLMLDRSLVFGIALGVLLVIAATFGDLLESQFKRDLGIKDMSAMLPGHGGLMDRLDGMLPAAAVMWVMVSLAEAVV